MIGQTISHYRILEKIGEGGMGEVFLAEDTKLDRKVALKFLPDFMQQDPVAEKRFLREAKSAAALDHPYVCKIYEVGEEDGRSFISMEYVQGETLKEKLAKAPLPLKDALETATEIAEALEAAHKHNIVHRDLKPSNIMLTPEGHVKVMDFGLAKQLFPAGDVEGQEQTITASLTKTGATLGTLAYMSPEQLRGEAVDTRSDVFSFGVVLYEMLTGLHPFKKAQPMETGNAILNEPAAPLSRRRDDIPVFLERTVKKMTAKEPDRRYQHIDDVRVDLEELKEESGSGGLDIAPSFERGPIQPVGTPRKSLLLGGGMVMLAVVASTIVLTLKPGLEPPLRKFQISIEVSRGHQGPEPAISPDGKMVAYTDGGRLWIRDLDRVQAREIPGTEGAENPFCFPLTFPP